MESETFVRNYSGSQGFLSGRVAIRCRSWARAAIVVDHGGLKDARGGGSSTPTTVGCWDGSL